MRVIVPGVIKDNTEMYEVECQDCGCVFEYDKGDQIWEPNTIGAGYYYVKCPTCGKKIRWGTGLTKEN